MALVGCMVHPAQEAEVWALAAGADTVRPAPGPRRAQHLWSQREISLPHSALEPGLSTPSEPSVLFPSLKLFWLLTVAGSHVLYDIFKKLEHLHH